MAIAALGVTVLLGGCFGDVETRIDEINTTVFNEKYRPQFHFSPRENWMNDPNGLVYYDGEYHLFFQHYPDSNIWGPMHWGHAVSSDLVHWNEIDIALYPDSLGYIFSGSAVIDWENTSGFGTDGNPPMVAIFTHHEPVAAREGKKRVESQSIAYSLDKGRTWTKYKDNPVLPNPGFRDFRDPKVFRDEERNRWVMVFAERDNIRFYSSPDLKSWTYMSNFGKVQGSHGGVWECPDLFPLAVHGTDRILWVLLVSINPGGPNLGSATQYFVGNFDGTEFKLDPQFADAIKLPESAVWLDYGRDNYAGVTWSDIPKQDGRRIFIGWMNNWDYAQVVPTSRWRSAMTLPRSLHLLETPAGPRVAARPLEELFMLRTGHESISVADPGTGHVLLKTPEDSSLLAEIVIQADASKSIRLELHNDLGEVFSIGYNAQAQNFYCDRTKSGNNRFSDKFDPAISTMPRISDSGALDMHFFIDRASVEFFADGGLGVMTEIFFPSEPYNSVVLYGDKPSVPFEATVYTLGSIWN